ncbi:MAG TPA: CYTH domain-containing protein [Candidatus Eisenbergiella intestinipullorum]|nr:CYTH domain-containing protein [Candidatus Eisenbergiella intestinipullorum]
MEIERKFTVRALPDDLGQYPCRLLEQGYLNTDPVVRVRRDGDEYYLTYKGKGLMAREEYNLPLTEKAYHHLIQKADGRIIQKRRYLIPCGSHTIELDVFLGSLSPLVIAEVEFSSLEDAQSFLPPDWFLEDVTMDPAYHNSNLSRTDG